MKSTKELREGTERRIAHAAGAIRRVAISLTSRALWQLIGIRQLDGKQEAFAGEPFLGIGFHSRPPSSGKPEAIVLMVGDNAQTPVVVAVRDEATRQAIAGALAADETAMFNSKSLFVAKASGDLEARSKNGVAASVAKKTDLELLKGAITGAATFGDFKAAVEALPAWPAGTSKFKAE